MNKIINKINTIDYKVKVTLLIIINILLLVVFCLNFKIMIYGNNTEISSKDFKNVLEKKGYKVEDITELYDLNDDIKLYYQATNKKKKSEISFMKMKNKKYTSKMFNQEKKSMIEDQENLRMILKHKQAIYTNYQEYFLYNYKTYYLTAQVNKDLIYVEIDKKNMNEVTDILEEVGFLKYKKISFLELSLFILGTSIIIFNIICWWIIFKKVGIKGWYYLIPVYGIYKSYEIVTNNNKLALLLIFIPFANLILYYRLAIVFGKNRKFSIFSMIFQSIGLYIIALDNSTYIYKEQ